VQCRRRCRQPLVVTARRDRIAAVTAGEEEETRQALGRSTVDFSDELTDFDRLAAPYSSSKTSVPGPPCPEKWTPTEAGFARRRPSTRS
jgi:hypothetical protein